MIYVMLAEGFEEIEALAFVDILRRAGVDVQTVSIHDANTVTGAHNIRIVADCVIREVDVEAMDGIVLPGGMPGAQNLKDNSAVTQLLQYAFKQDKLIGAICAAPMVLGALGLLDGKKAICYPGYESELHGAAICEARVVEDGMIITSMGPGTTAEFAGAFVRRICGAPAADTILHSMQYV